MCPLSSGYVHYISPPESCVTKLFTKAKFTLDWWYMGEGGGDCFFEYLVLKTDQINQVSVGVKADFIRLAMLATIINPLLFFQF